MSLMRKQTEIGFSPKIVWVINHLCEVGGGGVVEKSRKLCEAGGSRGGSGSSGGGVVVEKWSGDGGVKKWGKFYWCRE